LLFFIPIYAKIKCLQHSITYHGKVTVKTFFINVITTAVLQFTKYSDYSVH